MGYKQDAPFAVQIELAEGCNLYCGFCGLRGIREKPGTNFRFMERGTLRNIIEQIAEADGWNPRIEFAMHGEPTMHPEYIKMIAIARKYAPKLQIMMTSNGGGLLRAPGPIVNIGGLFKAGLNVLALDKYEGVSIVDKIISRLTEDVVTNKAGDVLTGSRITNATVRDLKEQNYICFPDDNIKVYRYPKEPEGNPHIRRPISARVISVIKDISKVEKGKGTHSLINNHAGAGAPPNKRQAGRRCAKPFREMSFRWDGSVAVCCNDWRGVYKCGNIHETNLLDIWHGAAMTAARHKLYHGMRDFGPCKGCDAVSYRVGLLPDKLGKVKLPEPTQRHLDTIDEACSGKPYTVPVLRPWELKHGKRQ